MAFALLFLGVMMIVSAIRNTHCALVALIANDFSGQNNFLYWVVALILIGSVGYIEKLKPISDGLLVLVLLALVLSRGNPKFNSAGGFFKQFTAALGTSTKPNPVIGASASYFTPGGAGTFKQPVVGGGVNIGFPGGSVDIGF